MLFNSLTFLIFVVITFFIYYLPYFHRYQVSILVIASLIFYSWESPKLLLLLIVSILLNAITSYNVHQTSDKKKRIAWATAGVIINLCILGFFKYAGLLSNFFLNVFHSYPAPEDSLIALLLHVPLPIGISFYTFEGISLLVDVLHQKEAIEQQGNQNKSFVAQNLAEYILHTSFFVSFFPHLVAGPILKARHFYPQIGPKYLKDIPWNIVFRYLVVGYFLKMVVADNLKDYTYFIQFYQGLGTSTGLILLFGYSIQIFADFAGYSLIAVGLAAACGYTLPDNFNFPYISRSLSEFWRRWHISLSAWLRDYLYIPLGGNRKGNVRTYINLMVVMTLGGLWHGASWNYAVWGIFHGVGLALERLFTGSAKKSKELSDSSAPLWKQFLLDSIKVVSIFCFVSIGWLFFNLSFERSIDFFRTMIQNIGVRLDVRLAAPVLIFSFPVLVYHGLHFPTFEGKESSASVARVNKKISGICQDIALAIMLALVCLNSGNSNEFIYFQF